MPATIAPYMPFRTLLNLIDRMAQDGAIPPQIDRSYLKGSEGGKTQVIAGMKALGLISDASETLPPLTALVENVADRPQLMREIVERVYTEPNRLGTLHATQAQLEAAFSTAYNVNGVTRRKAISFYLAAATFAGVPLSKHFKQLRASPNTSSAATARTAHAATPRRTRGSRNGVAPSTVPPTAPPVATADALKARYIEMLLKRIEEGNDLDDKLADRIEGLLGLGNADSKAAE